jgi:predicted site-specific integrase-resolvase
MREAVAKEYGFSLYRQYGEEQAAHILAVDHSTLKRWRAEGLTPYVRMGPRKVRYLGTHIADLLIKGAKSG